MMKAYADQYEGEIAVWKGFYHMGAAAYFPVEPLNVIVGPNPDPAFIGKARKGTLLLCNARMRLKTLHEIFVGICHILRCLSENIFTRHLILTIGGS